MHDKKLYGTVTVGTKGQVVIPAEAREAFQINTGDRLYVLGSANTRTVSLIPEEQVRTFIDAVTDNIGQYKDMLEKSDPEK